MMKAVFWLGIKVSTQNISFTFQAVSSFHNDISMFWAVL